MSVRYYRRLLGQPERIEAFRQAIREVVRPGERVLDVGCGLGTFAFFAADAGAGRVWAVDGDPIVHVARTLGRVNGYADRVAFLRGWLPELRVPQAADVVIFEDFPPRLLDTRTYRLLRHVQERCTASGWRAVPRAADLFAAPVGHEAVWREALAAMDDGEERYGIDWGASRSYVANCPATLAVAPEALAGPPVRLGAVRFDRSSRAADLGGAAVLRVEPGTTLHGLAFWFDLELSPSVRLSNAPGALPGSWGHVFLPVDPPVRVADAGKVRLEVGVDTLADGAPGWLRWRLASGDETVGGHEFAGFPASLADLVTAQPDHVPVLSAAGRIERELLDLVDGTRTVRELARAVRRLRPELDPGEAERLVIRLLHTRIERRATTPDRGDPCRDPIDAHS